MEVFVLTLGRQNQFNVLDISSSVPKLATDISSLGWVLGKVISAIHLSYSRRWFTYLFK